MSNSSRLPVLMLILGLFSASTSHGASALATSSSHYGLGQQASTAELARRLALGACRQASNSSNDCHVVFSSSADGFASVALDQKGHPFLAAAHKTPAEARQKALAQCQKHGHAPCRIDKEWQDHAQSNNKDSPAVAHIRLLQRQQAYEQAFQEIMVLAQQGDAEAQFQAGIAYQEGWGTDKNRGQARDWLGRAAAQGHNAASYALQAMTKKRTRALVLDGNEQEARPLNPDQILTLVQGMPPMASPDEVGEWIAKQKLGERQAAQAVFAWMADNIQYDTEAYFNNAPTFYDPANVFRTRRAVCEGYANLFSTIAQAAGLRAVSIAGFAKGYGYTPGRPLNEFDGHSWNAVWFDDSWHLLDSTWGAGHVNGEGRFVKKFSRFWFDVHPELFIFSHYPKTASAQYLPQAVSEGQFLQLPYVGPHFITNAINLGYPVPELVSALRLGDLLTAWEQPQLGATVLSAPSRGTLHLGQSYRINVNTLKNSASAILIDNQFIHDLSPRTQHQFTITPRQGSKLQLSFQDDSGNYWPLLEYRLSP